MTILMPVYIVNEELLHLTKNAVESFGEGPLVVIDNGSPLGGGYLRSVSDVYVRNTKNLGYARAVNQGLRLIQDPLIAIANNDVRPSPNWKDVVSEVFSDNPRTYSCHFRMTNYDETYQYGSSVFHTGKERWCTSSFFVINTTKFKQYYDEEFLNSYDDWDYWHTIRSQRFFTAYTDRACYQHHHSSTQKTIPTREEQNQKNREYFKQKWHEYPEDLYQRLYPDQFAQDYWKGFTCHPSAL